MTSHCRVTGHFETIAPNDPKMTLNTTRSKVRIYVLLMSQSPTFDPIRSTTHRFRDTKLSIIGNAPNDPLNGKRNPYTPITTEAQNVCLLSTMTSRFRDIEGC